MNWALLKSATLLARRAKPRRDGLSDLKLARSSAGKR